MSKTPSLLSFLPAPKTSSTAATTPDVNFLKTKPTTTTTETSSNNKSTNEKEINENSDNNINNKKTTITMLLPRSVSSAKAPTASSTSSLSSVKATTTTASTTASNTKQIITKQPEQKVVRSIVSYGYDDDDDEDDDEDDEDKHENKNEEEENLDFFNVNKKLEEEINDDKLPNTSYATTSNNIPFKKSKIDNYAAAADDDDEKIHNEGEEDEEEYDEEEEEGEDYEEDNEQVNKVDPPIEEILRSMGGSHKRRHEQIDFVDVNVNQIIQDNKEQLLKNISQQPIRPARKYTGGGRKKHQITYLAMLAKEQEQALQATWADNKFKRRQARQKYGF